MRDTQINVGKGDFRQCAVLESVTLETRANAFSANVLLEIDP